MNITAHFAAVRLLATCLALVELVGSAKGAERPNVLFILADDLGWRDLSCEGSEFYESPHIDRIARSGVRFSQGYAACSVCSPSRASVLTGKYPTNHGITTWIGDRVGNDWRSQGRHDSHLPSDYRRSLSKSEVTLAEVLRANGYATFFAGKWHLGGEGSWPEDHGFDTNIGGWDSGSPRGGYFAPWENPKLASTSKGESLPLRLANETAAFIESSTERPFFAFLSFYSVHGPIQTTAPLWKKYRDKAVSERLTRKRFVFDRRLSVRTVQDNPVYAGMIQTMDDAVGVVLKALEENGLDKNTIVCFTSDNGGVSSGDAFATSNLPLRGGKGRQWEAGTRVPFYVRAPGVTRAGALCQTPVSGIDWYPTLLDLVGLPVPTNQKIDGASLAPLLRGKRIPARPLYWHYPHYGNQGGEPSSIIRSGDWKLIAYHEDQRRELYNLAYDGSETHDVAHLNPNLVARMGRELDEWLQGCDAKLPSPDPQFDARARSALWKQRATAGQDRLESQHAKFLDPAYAPNADWWGSTP